MIKSTKLNPADFELLAYRHARRVILATGMNDQEVEDIKQQILLQLVKVADKYDPNRASACTYAFIVLQNAASVVINRYMAAHLASHDEEIEPVRERRNDQRQTEMRLDIETAFSRLPANDAEILLELQDATFNEVAARHQMTGQQVVDIRNRHRETLLQAGLESAPSYGGHR